MPTSTRVLVTGAGGPAGMGTIRSLLLAGGIKVIAADMNPLAPGLYWAHKRRLLPPAGDPGFIPALRKVCSTLDIDVLFPTVDEEIAVLAASIKRLPRTVRCPIGSKAGVEACNDKLVTHQWLKKSGIPVVETRRITDEGSLRESAREIGFPAAIKPRASRGGRGLYICRDSEGLARAYRALKSRLPFSDAYVDVPEASDIIVQEYLPGTEFDAIVLLGRKGEALACVPMRARRWNVQDHQREIVTEHDEEIEELSIKTVRSLGLECPVDVELARDRDGVFKILDVNPRIGGDVELATAAGCNIPLMYVRKALDCANRPCKFKEGVVLVRYTGIQVIQPGDIPRGPRRRSDERHRA